MFDKKVITEMKDWSHIDYICVKSKSDGLHTDIYYLDGHPNFEASLTVYDKNFIDFTRKIDCYGISEKMISDGNMSDRFYVRVNINNEQQELKLIDYLQKKKKLSNEQHQILDYFRHIRVGINEDRDYRSLYYCGFSKKNESAEYDSIRFYFKTFGADESLRYDFDFINYCAQCPQIKADETFPVIRDLVLNERAGLRCIGVDITDSCLTKIKYYLYPTDMNNSVNELLLELKRYPQYIQNVDTLLKIMDNIQDLHCDLIQISGGGSGKETSINLYLNSPIKYKKKYYSIRDGLVLRDIGGVVFLVDIHEKHYYDLKNLFSVNETGKTIIEYMTQQGVCTVDGIVSHLRSVIKDYDADLYPIIYSDCEMFVEQLQKNGYLLEVM